MVKPGPPSKKNRMNQRYRTEIQLPDELAGLSDREKAGFLVNTGRPGGFVAEKDESVSQKAHEDAVNELKEKIRKLEEQLESVRNDKKNVVDERDQARRSFENANNRANELQESLDAKNDECRRLREENQKLGDKIDGYRSERSDMTDAALREKNDEIDRLGKKLTRAENDRDRLSSENQDLSDRVSNLEKENSRLQHEKEELGNAMAKASGTMNEAIVVEGEVCGTIARRTPDSFSSDLFRDGNYDVRISRDGSYIRFTPDVEGKATCIDGSIRLPAMADMMRFEEPVEYDAIKVGETEIRILF